MVFIKMLQTKMAINASRAMRNDFIWPKFLFKPNTMQPCLSKYTIPRVVQLKTNVFIADETRDVPCVPVLPENFQSAQPVFCSALISSITIPPRIPWDLHQKFAPTLGLLHPSFFRGGICWDSSRGEGICL